VARRTATPTKPPPDPPGAWLQVRLQDAAVRLAAARAAVHAASAADPEPVHEQRRALREARILLRWAARSGDGARSLARPAKALVAEALRRTRDARDLDVLAGALPAAYTRARERVGLAREGARVTVRVWLQRHGATLEEAVRAVADASALRSWDEAWDDWRSACLRRAARRARKAWRKAVRRPSLRRSHALRVAARDLQLVRGLLAEPGPGGLVRVRRELGELQDARRARSVLRDGLLKDRQALPWAERRLDEARSHAAALLAGKRPAAMAPTRRGDGS